LVVVLVEMLAIVATLMEELEAQEAEAEAEVLVVVAQLELQDKVIMVVTAAVMVAAVVEVLAQ
jgi:hypothetical protein